MTELEVGMIAPDFTLKTDGDGELALQSLRGKKVVLYFYPKDSTPGCTTEGNDFSALYSQFSDANTVIVGASKDTVKRHDAFKAKYDFPFTLVSDEEGVLCEAYGVWVLKKNYGKEYMGIERATFLINADGTIAQVWRKVRVKEHAQNVLDAVLAL